MTRPRETYHRAITGQKAFGDEETATQILGGGQRGWREAALCAQIDPELWFPVKGFNPAHAKKVYQVCPVRQECLTWALTNGEESGVWGGFTGRTLRTFQQAVRAGASTEDVVLTALYGQEALQQWAG